MSACRKELRVLVQGGAGGSEHDQIFLQQVEPADVGGRIKGSSSACDIPGDSVGDILVF